MFTIKLGNPLPMREREMTVTYAGEHLITKAVTRNECDHIFGGFLTGGKFQIGVFRDADDAAQRKCIENIGASKPEDLVFILREEDITEFKIIGRLAYVESIETLEYIRDVRMCFITFEITKRQARRG